MTFLSFRQVFYTRAGVGSYKWTTYNQVLIHLSVTWKSEDEREIDTDLPNNIS
jgi:hypothetical protein